MVNKDLTFAIYIQSKKGNIEGEWYEFPFYITKSGVFHEIRDIEDIYGQNRWVITDVKGFPTNISQQIKRIRTFDELEKLADIMDYLNVDWSVCYNNPVAMYSILQVSKDLDEAKELIENEVDFWSFDEVESKISELIESLLSNKYWDFLKSFISIDSKSFIKYLESNDIIRKSDYGYVIISLEKELRK